VSRTTVVHDDTPTREQFLDFCMLVRFTFLFVFLFSFFCLFVCSSMLALGHFVLVLLAFVQLGLVSSVLSQETVWEERLRNDLFWTNGT